MNQPTLWQNRIVKHGMAKVAEIILNPNNWRTHPKNQYEAIAASLGEIGWVKSVQINITTGNLIDGHARVILADQKHQAEVPAEYVELTEDEEKLALRLLDPLSEMAGKDREKDYKLLTELMEKTHDQGITELLERMAKKEDYISDQAGAADDMADVQEPTVAEKLKEKYKTEVGQIWKLGRHRIVCGDSNDRGLIKRLFAPVKQPIACVWTDPPYGVDYESDKTGKIENDDKQGNRLVEIITKSLALALEKAKDTAAWYIWHATSTRREFEWILDAVGLQESQYLVWLKDSFTMGWTDYHWQMEPCFYAHKAGFKPDWFGSRNQGTTLTVTHVKGSDVAVSISNGLAISDGIHPPYYLSTKSANKKLRHIKIEEGESIKIGYLDGTDCLQISRKAKNDYIHPTEKPVELAVIQITNSSPVGGLIYDPFHGGGSGLVACEQTGRQFLGCDLDPRWTAATIEKWVRMTGGTPELEK